MKKIILDHDDRIFIKVGNVVCLDITVEKAFKFLASRKKIDNSNTDYEIKKSTSF